MDVDPQLHTLREAASGGDPDAVARLASSLVSGGQVEEGFTLYGQAADAGHPQARVESARMQLHGVGCAADVQAAIAQFMRGESEGNVVCSYHLALVAVAGFALPFDESAEARVLAAINAGYPPALRAAALHFGRRGNDEDQSRCLQLLERAAHSGDAVSALLLSARVGAGEGCPPNAAFAAQLHARLAQHAVLPLPRVSVAAPRQPELQAGALYLREALLPVGCTVLSREPRVGVVEQLLSADECRLLVAMGAPRLQRSRTLHPVTGAPLEIELRTSSDASIDPIFEDLSLRLIQLRLATAAGLPLVNAEPLIVLRYQPGEQYRPHRDYLPPAGPGLGPAGAGNRARTICAYLNTVGGGGRTTFPLLGVGVDPVPGHAVVFDNLDPHGAPDPSTLHAGEPVAAGEKWLATLWIRQRRFRDF